MYFMGEPGFMNAHDAQPIYVPHSFGSFVSDAKTDPEKQFQLGIVYMTGRYIFLDNHHVGKNNKLSTAYFESAAIKGHAPSMAELAVDYYLGRGREEDLVLATVWTIRAQRAGADIDTELMFKSITESAGDKTAPLGILKVVREIIGEFRCLRLSQIAQAVNEIFNRHVKNKQTGNHQLPNYQPAPYASVIRSTSSTTRRIRSFGWENE